MANKVMNKYQTTDFRKDSKAAANSTYKKLVVQWLNDTDSYRYSASFHSDIYRK